MLTTTEIASALGVSIATIKIWRTRGLLRGRRSSGTCVLTLRPPRRSSVRLSAAPMTSSIGCSSFVDAQGLLSDDEAHGPTRTLTRARVSARNGREINRKICET
jgi:hypothetical protein